MCKGEIVMKLLPARLRGRRLAASVTLTAAALLTGMVAAPADAAAHGSGAQASAQTAVRAPAPHPLYQTPQQASEQAKRTGKPVVVTGATTPDSTLTAEPNGTFSTTSTVAPVRAKIKGIWRSLDPDLTRNANGTLSPEVSSEPLSLSGGGTGPLATMTSGVYSMALTTHLTLPAPTISGDTATYREVLPGVNLVLSAQASGGVDETLVIANAAAAANPALRSLTFTTRMRGLTLRSGHRGAIEAVSPDGEVIFAAPQPRMWNSAAMPTSKTINIPGLGRVSKATGLPARSSIRSPGASAASAPMGVRVTRSSLTLTPDRAVLTGAGPFYLDPTWLPGGGNQSSWAYVSDETTGIAAQHYYDTSLYLQVGQDPDGGVSYAYYTLPMQSGLGSATINSVTAYFPEVWSYSCTASTVDLYGYTSKLSNSTTYNNRPTGQSGVLGSDDVAYGWSSSGAVGGPSNCGYSLKDVSFTGSPLLKQVQTEASKSVTSYTVGLTATDTSDSYGWKLFANPDSGTSSNDQDGYAAIAGNASWTINYAYPPGTPSLTTSPPASCSGGTTVLGNGAVTLDADVPDTDGSQLSGGVDTTFTAYAAGNTADTILSASSETVGTSFAPGANSGSASYAVTQAQLDSADSKWGSGGQVQVKWTAQASLNGLGISGPIASCTFIFSTVVPGAPVIHDSNGNVCGTDSL
jgi:hypothetical protein